MGHVMRSCARTELEVLRLYVAHSPSGGLLAQKLYPLSFLSCTNCQPALCNNNSIMYTRAPWQERAHKGKMT